MSAHISSHHRRAAARALIRRELLDVPLLEERFSPTAIFPGMTEVPDDPDPPRTHALPTPPLVVGPPGHHNGHTIETPVTSAVDIPTAVTPPSPPPVPTTSTPVVVTHPTTTSSTPTVAPVTTTSTSSVQSSPKPTVITSTSVAPTTIRATTSASRVVATSAAASASATTDEGSGVGTGAIVGGIGAAIVAVAAIVFAIVFFIRRARKRTNDDLSGFDAHDFRRSAVLIHDPPTHEDTIARGYNAPPPPPPPMMERQLAFATMPSGYNNGYNEPYYGESPANQEAHSYYPGQYSPYGPVVNANLTPTSAQPLYPGQNPFSPISPLPSPYPQPSASSVLTRQPSSGSYATGQAPAVSSVAAYQPSVTTPPGLSRQLTVRSEHIPSDDYVDLSRSSVSPFQAAQYVEISRKLNTESPVALNGSPAQVYATQQKELPPAPSSPVGNAAPVVDVPETVSPFADPEQQQSGSVQSTASPAPVPSPPPSVHMVAPTPVPVLTTQTLHLPALSTDSRMSQEALEFPVPPSPTLSYSSRYRVESLPPSLPEINLEERSSLSSYISKNTLGVPSNVSSVGSVSALGLRVGPDQRFVPASSPLANSVIGSSGDEESGEEAQKETVGQSEVNQTGSSVVPTTTEPASTTVATTTTVSNQPAAPSAGASKLAVFQRPNTVYDPEEAYGGI